MNNDPNSDSGIPLLTEIVPPNAADKAGAQAASATPPKPPMTGAAPAMPPRPAVTAPAAPIARTTSVPPAPPIAKPAVPATAVPARPASAPAATVPPAPPSAPQATSADLHAGPPLTEEEWARLENVIHQRIARQVLERIDFVLDHRVRHALTDVVDRAVDGVATEIKNGLHETLNDIISRAVAQEISRFQALKK